MATSGAMQAGVPVVTLARQTGVTCRQTGLDQAEIETFTKPRSVPRRQARVSWLDVAMHDLAVGLARTSCLEKRDSTCSANSPNC
jgi:hypothetical protein